MSVLKRLSDWFDGLIARLVIENREPAYVGSRRDPKSWTAPTREVPAVAGRRFRAGTE